MKAPITSRSRPASNVYLSRIPASGGTPAKLTDLAPGEIAHRWPQVLPGGKAFLFSAYHSMSGLEGVCLVHSRMTGAIHVLPPAETLPHSQSFYDRQTNEQRFGLLAEAAVLSAAGNAEALENPAKEVLAGASSIHSNGGGSQTVTVMRFFGATTIVHVGDTVEWTNVSTPVFHTVTFGTEPLDDTPPSPGVTVDDDGARHAVISSPNESVNSGFIGIPNHEAARLPEAPLDITRFRVTFTAPGVFNYVCALHDNLGMKGTVIVRQ
jgi:plastocyanin